MHIRNLLIGAAAAGALALTAGAASAATTATATASANIVAANSITNTNNSTLDFGTITRPTTGSNTFTVAAQSGTQTPALGGTGDGAAVGSTATAASFLITGVAGKTVGLTGSLSFTGAGAPTGSAVFPTALTIGSDGSLTVPVGGQITVSSTTPATSYSGTLSVDVTFN